VHLLNTRWKKFKFGLGRGSINYVELMNLKLAPTLATGKGVHRTQVFGDSQVVFKWMEGHLLVITFFYILYLMRYVH
jgi:ribonuclease HI